MIREHDEYCIVMRFPTENVECNCAKGKQRPLVDWEIEMEEKTKDTNPKKAHGALKAPMDCVPNTALIELYGVMGGGAWKYGIYNYRDSEIDALTYIGAIRRHFMLWEDGQDIDGESGRSHLAHIMACCALALDAQHTGKLVDNRSKTGLVEDLLKQIAADHNVFCDKYPSIKEVLNGKKEEEGNREV